MTTVLDLPLSKRLKALTSESHQSVDDSIMSAASFEDQAGYVRFLIVQYLFHRDLAALYDDSRLQALLPDLAERGRLAQVAADLSDLDHDLPAAEAPIFTAGEDHDLPTALGWLYVVEGSKLGGALLRKEAARIGLSDDFGARHLAPTPDGPAAHWRAFAQALDAVPLDTQEDQRAGEGALAAFARVQALIDARRP